MTVLAAIAQPERFAAMRSWPALPEVDWAVWAPLLAAGVAAALLAVAGRRWVARRKMLAQFAGSAARNRLTRSERAVLTSIASLAELERFGDVYLSQPVFERGLSRLMESKAVAAMGPAARRSVRAAVESLRLKLEFPEGPAARRRMARAGAALVRDNEVTLVRRGEAEGVLARVASVEGRDVALVASGGPESRAGEACVLRRGHDGLQWEFDAAVAVAAEGLTVVRLIGEPRCVNLRRFARVSTHKAAYVAHYPLLEAGASDALPRFVPATLTEIGGPGIRLDAPLRVAPGDRVLALARIDADTRLHGIGQVRRVIREDGDSQAFAVELVGLSEKEIGRLVHETNDVARRGPTPAAAPKSAALAAVGLGKQ